MKNIILIPLCILNAIAAINAAIVLYYKNAPHFDKTSVTFILCMHTFVVIMLAIMLSKRAS